MTQDDQDISTSSKQSQKLLRAGTMHWFHWVVISLSIVLTISAWYFSKMQLSEKVEERFHRETDRVVELVKERMQLYENALWGGVALYDASEKVTYPEWVIYAKSLQIDKIYPGINGIGVIHNIQSAGLEAYFARERKWRPDYKIHPKHHESEYWPITYVEPVGPNQKAIGLDMAFETNRYTAIKKARDTGQAQVTGPIILVQDAKKTPGFLFYTPFYKEGQKPQTIEERRENIDGVTYAPFIMHKLMEGTLAQRNRHVGLKISDGGELLYDDHSSGSKVAIDEDPFFRKTVQMSMYGRTWTFDLWSNQDFRAAASSVQPYMILFGGVVIDSLLFMLFFLISRSNQQAISYADRKTQELQQANTELASEVVERKHAEETLRENEEKARAVLDTAPDAILTINQDGTIESINTASEKIFGYAAQELIGKNVKMLMPSPYQEEHDGYLGAYLRTGQKKVIGSNQEVVGQRKDGTTFPLSLAVGEFKRDGQSYFTGIVQDITERVQAQEALRMSESRFALAMRGTSDGLWDWDIVTDEVWYAPRFKELLGYAEDEFPHTFENWESCLHPEDKEPTLEAIRQHLDEDEFFDTEYRLKNKDGEYRWFRARGIAQRDDAGKPIRMAGSIQDTHDQKRAQQEVNRYAGDLWRAREEIKATQKRFEIAVDGASDGLWDWNIVTNEIWYSHRFKDLLGYSDKDFQNLFESWKSVIHPEHRPSVMESLTRHLEASKSFDVEYRAQTKRGEYRWYRSRGKAIRDKSGKAIRMAGAIQDITDRKKTEVQLRRQATAMSSTLEGIAILDDTGRFTYMNQAHAAVYGYDQPDRLIGQSWEILYSPNEVARLQSGAFVVLSNYGKWQGEVTGRMCNGDPVDAEISLTALEGGELVCVCRDITDRKHAETELAHRAEELEKSNKELDDFAYIASHDLKEPLRGIHNYATFLIEDYQGTIDEDGMAKLATLQRLTQRMEKLIDTLLEFSRVGRVDLAFEETDLDQVLSDVMESLRVRLDEIGIDVRTPAPLPMVQCDRARIGEVFRNLVTNAMKYNDKPDKWIEIGVADNDLGDGELEAKGDDVSAKGQFVFYVRDNGIGIPEKHMNSIFRIFKRLHGRDKFGGGTGAGLTIVKKIVERHGGRVWVESTYGEGTTFKFTLEKAA